MGAFMMDSGGMARDPVWGRFITAMVMYSIEHGGTTLFMERVGTIFTVATVGFRVFGRGRLMTRGGFMPGMGASSFAIFKMDDTVGSKDQNPGDYQKTRWGPGWTITSQKISDSNLNL